MRKERVLITWNGMGGPLDSVTVMDDSDRSVTNALIKMIEGQVVSPGDSFTVEEVK